MQNKYWYTVFRKSRRKFSGWSIENKINILQSATKFTTRKQHWFWTANIKSYDQRKTLKEIFDTFNLSFWLQHRIQRLPWSSNCGVFTRETVKHLCQMMARYKVLVYVTGSFLFLSPVIKFDKKCANSTQGSQSPNSWGWPLFLQSQKIYSPRRSYLSPGNSIILEIAATLLIISITIFCWFWGSFCWNSSTLPKDLFIFVNPSCLQSTTTKILPYHISTQVCKFVKLENYTSFTKTGNITKSFSGEKLIETNNIFAIRGKKTFLFQLRACKQETQFVLL